jgi:hypothetical protein
MAQLTRSKGINRLCSLDLAKAPITISGREVGFSPWLFRQNPGHASQFVFRNWAFRKATIQADQKLRKYENGLLAESLKPTGKMDANLARKQGVSRWLARLAGHCDPPTNHTLLNRAAEFAVMCGIEHSEFTLNFREQLSFSDFLPLSGIRVSKWAVRKKCQRWHARPLRNIEPELSLLVVFVDCGVAFACRVFQSRSVQNRHRASTVVNQPGSLQDAGGNRYAWPARTEHLRQELVRQRDQIRLKPILAHEQPLCQPLSQIVQSIAPRHLRNLNTKKLRETVKLALESRTLRETGLQIPSANLKSITRYLNHRPCRRDMESGCHRCARKTIAPDQSDLYRVPVLHHRKDRDHSSVDEIGRLHLLACFLENRMLSKRDEFQPREKPSTITRKL